MVTINDLYDLTHTRAEKYLSGFVYPWEALKDISAMIRHLGSQLPSGEFQQIRDGVWIHRTATVAPTAYLGAPCIIGARTEVRHCAFIREAALVGEDCVVGNSVELKNVILFDGVQVPHYNYVGDSILGYKAHLGAGAVTSNLKSDKTPVVIHSQTPIPTGLKKVGAMVGDRAEVGCNSVLNPGTVIGKRASIYPCSSVRGVIPADSIYKHSNAVVKRV